MQWLRRIPLAIPALLVILLPMLVRLVQDWHALGALPYGTLIGPNDPDPWLRLTLVRDLLTSGDWYSHAVTRSGAPFFDTVSPWTRPLDVVIAALSQLQPLAEDLSLRLMRAALLLPIVWMGLLLLGIYRATRLLSPLPVAPLVASGLVAAMPVIRNYFGIGNADHHAMLAVVFVWAFGGILHTSPRHWLTCLNGALLGLLLWISPEGMVLIAAIFGWYGLCWLRGDRTHAAPLPLLATSTAITTVIAVLIERPPGEWLTPVYDSISIVYAIMLGGVALTTWPLFYLPLRTCVARGKAAMLAITLVGGVVLSLYPAMWHGPLTGLDPYIYSHFLPRIVETQPLLQKPTLYILAMLLTPMAALTFLALAWQRDAAILTRHQVLQLTYFIVVTFGLYLTQQRFYYYCAPLLIISLTPFLSALLMPEHRTMRDAWPARWLITYAPMAQAWRRLLLLGVIVGVPLLLLWQSPSRETEASRKIDACQQTARRLIRGGVLNTLGDGKPMTLFISTDLGGDVLFFTPHRIIASNYHREGAGIRYIWKADRITYPILLRAYLAMRKVDALLICPVVHPAKESVLQQLQQGAAPPPWLTPVPYDMPPEGTHPPRIKGSNPALFLVKPPR